MGHGNEENEVQGTLALAHCKETDPSFHLFFFLSSFYPSFLPSLPPHDHDHDDSLQNKSVPSTNCSTPVIPLSCNPTVPFANI